MSSNAFRGIARERYRSVTSKLRRMGLLRNFRDTPNSLERRAALKERIDLCRMEGRLMWVYEWGRDCDMMEADCVYLMPASVMCMEQRIRDVESNAEGPWSCFPITDAERCGYRTTARDRIAEAWDNGNTAPYVQGPLIKLHRRL